MLDSEKNNPSKSPYKGTRGIKRLINATRYSMNGFCSAWQNEAAFRQELLLTIVLTPAAFLLTADPIERLLLIGSLLLILIVELLNSAIESIVDRVGIDHHELSGRAKDMGSAAVFLTLLLATITWALILTE